jgi:arsenate reductase-like glutaredoxin family protein
MVKNKLLLLVLLIVISGICSCASTYRTTITETHTNKIEMYFDEYKKGQITKQQLNDLIMIYIEEMEQ